MRRRSSVLPLMILTVFLSCEKPTLVVPEPEDLSGYWVVLHTELCPWWAQAVTIR